MKQRSPTPLFIIGSLIVAGLCTISVDGGWLVWIPVLVANIVVSKLQSTIKA